VRRWWTWLVVAVLVVLGLAAAVDAVRGDGRRSEPRAARATTPPPAALARQSGLAVSQLREAGAAGVLTYADEDCRLHALSLPELEPVRAPSFESCEPHISTGGIGAFDGDIMWSGLGFGTAQVVLSQEELTRAIRRRPGLIDDARVRAVQAVWLGERRYVVLAETVDSPHERVVVGLEGHRADFALPQWRVRGARIVRPSARGGYYALLGSDSLGVEVFTRDGHDVPLPSRVTLPHTIAWSPDDRWTALATRASVYLFRTERPNGLVVRIPLAVQDLDWSDAN